MVSSHTQDIADRANAIYGAGLQATLESQHLGQYVAIEPDSGDFFIAQTYADAIAKARASHPDRISFVIRIGHQAAIHLGGLTA